MIKIGLFGGTFNPVHNAHLRAAVEIRDIFRLDAVEFIPAALPPHKNSRELATPEMRVEMIRLAVSGKNGLSVSDVELMRSGRSFTVDTLESYRKRYCGNAMLFFIIGLDAFLDIHTWKSHEALFRMASFIVMTRPNAFSAGIADNSGNDNRKTRDMSFSVISDYVKKHISVDYEVINASETEMVAPAPVNFSHPTLHPVYFQPITALDISASEIRRLVRERRSISYLTPEVVETFILSKGLYV